MTPPADPTRAALEFYAQEINYEPMPLHVGFGEAPVEADRGTRARAALAALGARAEAEKEAPLEVARMTQAEFNALLEYSCSTPTGTTIGKRWKANLPSGWHLGEYVPHSDPGVVGIKYLPIEVTP